MPPKRKADDAAEEADAKRKILDEISARIMELDVESARDYLDTMCAKWQIHTPATSFEHVISMAFMNAGLDVLGDVDTEDSGSYGVRGVDDCIHEQEIEAIALYHKLRELEMLEDETILKHMNRVMESIFYAKRIVLSALQSRIAMQQNLELDDDLDARLGSWAIRFRWLDEKVNEVQRLLLHLLDTAMEKKYRKQGDLIFEPIIIDGCETHAWRQVCSMEDFVYRECQKEVNVDAWMNLTNAKNNAKTVVEYLVHCNDYQFRWLKKDRLVWAFRNGCYLGREDAFHSFKDPETPLGDSVVACKFFDMDFPVEHFSKPWREIPTPAFESILTYQGLPPEVIDWLYILIGRMTYPIGEKDGWQVIPFLLGIAGSGKSSITLDVVEKMYETVDVGVLSNNTEQQFGLSAFHDKFIFVAPEVKADLKLEQAEFQSIVSGEATVVCEKYKTAFAKKWTAPGFLAGNQVPAWSDNSGSIQRRIPIFRFDKPVENGDMMLGHRLHAEMGLFILKACRAYKETAEAYGCKMIWEIIPEYFKATRDELAAAVNPVDAFIKAGGDLILDPNVYCPFQDFKMALKTYELANGFKGSKYTVDFFKAPLMKYGLQLVRASMEYRGRKMHCDFVIGADIAVQGEGNILG